MTAYTVAAIPTLYNGRQYRSRLEAKWAAFFDRLSFRFEYEPFELGSWSPDFVLSPLRYTWAGSAMVEVKPITEFSRSVADKMVAATTNSPMHHRLLLVGVQPTWDGEFESSVKVGWAGVRSSHDGSVAWHEAHIEWLQTSVYDRSPPRLVPDIVAPSPWASRGEGGLLTGYGADIAETTRERFYSEYVMSFWADATNAVQWRGKGARL